MNRFNPQFIAPKMRLLVVGLFTIIACLIALTMDVQAISNVAPYTPDFVKSTGISNAEASGHTMRLVVDQTGAQIDASIVAIYLPTASTSWTINITDADNCGNYDLGSLSTNYVLETYTPVNGIDLVGGPGGACPDNRTLSLTLSRATLLASSGAGYPTTFAGGQTFYKIKLRATIGPTNGNSNGFGVTAPTGSYVSYYSQSTNKFALQDRQAEPDSQWRYTDYTLRFAPSCDITTTIPATDPRARVHWYDDDWGTPASLAIQRNHNAGEHYRMQVIEQTRAGATTNTWTINSNGSNNAQSWNFPDTTGFTGNQNNSYAAFPIRPNHRYLVRFLHVRKANAIQFQLPFDSIYWQFPCETNDPPTIAATATCTAITGTARDPDGATTVQAGVQLGTGGAIQTLSDTGVNGAFSIPIPNSLKSGFTNTIVEWVRVDDIGPGSGGFVYDTTPFGTTTDNLVSLGTCGTMWDYYPQTPTGPADSATGPKPGDTITVRGSVLNSGDGTGRAYTHLIQVAFSPSGPWNAPGGLSSSQSGIGAGATRALPHNYTIPSNRPDGSQVCFRTGATPVTGQTAPTSTVTNSGTRYSPALCYTVYNLRFFLEDPVIAPGLTGRFVSPGQPINPDFTVENTGNGPTPPSPNQVRIEYSSGLHQPGSPNLSTVDRPVIPAGGPPYTNSETYTIPNNATVGNQYCVSIRALPQQGYSDGTGTSGVTDTTEYCYIVTNAPYLKVYGNDSWAGFQFSNGTSCSPGRGLAASIGRGSAGAADEYGVFAYGNIDSFGSANSPLSHLMKFANTPTHGSFGADRCVPDYFSLLSPQSTPTGQGLTGLITGGNPDDGQYVYNSGQSTNGVNNYQKQQTILINGNLNINGNIQYSGNYARNDVPILVFVVRGNIFINPGVTRLDGIYIAIPNGGNNGVIDTCATDSNINDFDPLAAPANGSGTCDQPLEINGSFIAQNIYFRRTSGGINEAHSGQNVSQRCRQAVLEGGNDDERCAAEIFRFSPEAYLARPYFDIGQPDSNLQILQLRDLPPVF